jgi:phenylacetate-CoA ligase
MRRLGLGPPDFETLDDLAKLPLIEREQLQRDPEYFVSRAEPLANYVEVHTSGSTGEPITFFRHMPGISQQVLGFDRMEPTLAQLSGTRWRRRDAVIVPPQRPDEVVDDTPEVQWLGLHVRAICRCFSVFDAPAKIAPRIDEFRPHLVKGYGSYVEELYTHLASKGGSFHRPNVVLYAGDPISDPARRLLAEDLGIAVVSVYQAVEVGIIGWECERQCGHHLNLDLYPIRVVDSNRREVPIGDIGQVVSSNLVNRGTVLLRYVLGDMARRLPNSCRCGRSLPLMSLVEGRTTDWLRSASGRPVHPQAVRSVISQMQGVRRYQLVQERPGHVKVVAVTAPGADREEIRSAAVAAGRRLEDPMDTEVEFSETLPRTEGGKVRTLLRHEVGEG